MNSLEKRLNRRIRTSLYQDQRFTSAELDLLHTPSLQRLYDLRQLGFADRVFVDASHSRLSHVLGVMETSTRLCYAIVRNLEKKPAKNANLGWQQSGVTHSLSGTRLINLFERRIGAIRLMALLHDLTHAPFGHTLEDEIKLVQPSHDHPSRQAAAFYQLIVEFLAWTTADTVPLSKRLLVPAARAWERFLSGDISIGEMKKDDLVTLGVSLLDHTDPTFGRSRVKPDELAGLLIDLNFAMRALYYLEISHNFDNFEVPERSYPANDLIEEILRGAKKNERAMNWSKEEREAFTRGDSLHDEKFVPARDAYSLDIIGNTICADLLDYANRDSVNAGLPLSFDVARIIENFTVISYNFKGAPGHPFSGSCLRAAVEFSNVKFRGDVVGELMQLLQVRYYVYERMLFHPTKCVAGAMLGRAVQLLGFSKIPEEWQSTGDAVFLHQLREVAELIEKAIREEMTASANAYYFSDVAERIVGRLPKIGLSSVDIAVNALRQRVPTMGSFRAEYSKKFQGSLLVTRLLHAKQQISHDECYFAEMFASALQRNSAPDEEKITPEIVSQLVAEIASTESGDRSFDIEKVKSNFQRCLPELSQILEEVRAVRLIAARLRARRYAKRIYCLMPRNIQAAGMHVDREDVASRFLDPRLRAAAEKAIERQAKLPTGSVVIHCPPAKGPKKLAKVLVTYLSPGANRGIKTGVERHTALLREIGDIGGPIKGLFKSHQEHMNSLEEMYSSMWRLWVAVAPPIDKEHQKLGRIISEVVSACVFNGGPHTPLPNDVFMVEELVDMYSPEPAESENVVNEIPPVAPSSKAHASAAHERVLTVKEIEAILEPYLASFAKSRRNQLQKLIDEQKIIERLIERSANPEIAQTIRRLSIQYPLSAPTWDARDIRTFLDALKTLGDLDISASFNTREVSYRRLSSEERADVDSVRTAISREIFVQGLTNANGALLIAAFAKSRHVEVRFQPLITPGLYAQSRDKHLILVSCESSKVEAYTKLFVDGESTELLPPNVRFTLAHELVHYLIGTRGEQILRGKDESRSKELTERTCQQLAGEMLVPDTQIDELVRLADFDAKSVRDTCVRLGVHPRHLIIRMDENKVFQNLPYGYAVSYARLVSSKAHLKNSQFASNNAMSGKFQTLRELGSDDALPFADILPLKKEGAQRIPIPLSSLDPNTEADIELSMVEWPASSAASKIRLVVAKSV